MPLKTHKSPVNCQLCLLGYECVIQGRTLMDAEQSFLSSARLVRDDTPNIESIVNSNGVLSGDLARRRERSLSQQRVAKSKKQRAFLKETGPGWCRLSRK